MKYIKIPTFFILLALVACRKDNKFEANKDWPVYLGGNSSSQFSPLTQINKENVDQLELAWEFSTGDVGPKDKTQMQCNPVIINGVMYGSSPKLKVFALNAGTGKKLWMYDPNAKVKYGLNVNRGVSYWRDGDDERIFFTAGPDLICLDAKTGVPVETFGNGGKTLLTQGVEEWAQDYFIVATSPGIVYKDKLIIGSRVAEGITAAPGMIHAFDVRTGALEWTFYTVPRPGENGYETWPEDAYNRLGGANAWAGMSLDEKRGLVYIPTGSAAYDFYGGIRKGKNLFANCILALEAETGKYVWHFQTVHHDLWDRDIPAPPNLVRIKHEGKWKDVVVTTTKSGFTFVLDRDTGEPVFPVEEREVLPSYLIGEEAWPTQPFPVAPPPFTRQKFTEDEVTNLSDTAHDFITQRLKSLRTGEPFIPPSIEGSVLFPGFDGGASWGGNAYDQESGVLFVNAKEIPCIITMEPRSNKKIDKVDIGEFLYQKNCDVCHGKNMEGNPAANYPSLIGLSERYKREEAMQVIQNGKGGLMPGFNHLDDEARNAILNYVFGNKTKEVDPHEIGMDDGDNLPPYKHMGYERFVDEEGYPGVKPPWGTLTAIDLNNGTIKWQVPLGEDEKLTARGIPKTGLMNYGGPVVTSGGVVFIAATKDGYFRAFDKDSGEEMWKYKLPTAGFATPSIYEAGGKQFVVVACGGGKGTPSGDKYLAFALPDQIEQHVHQLRIK